MSRRRRLQEEEPQEEEDHEKKTTKFHGNLLRRKSEAIYKLQNSERSV